MEDSAVAAPIDAVEYQLLPGLERPWRSAQMSLTEVVEPAHEGAYTRTPAISPATSRRWRRRVVVSGRGGLAAVARRKEEVPSPSSPAIG